MRVKTGIVRRRRHKKILKMAKGFYSGRRKHFRKAKEQIERSLVYAFRDRKQNKRNFRQLFIIRINAGCRLNGINYSKFINGLKKSLGVAIIGAIFPFVAGYLTAVAFGFSHNSSMVWGLTMTATAVSLTMMSLKNTQMHKTKAATGIMTAAVVDDVLSLIGVAILIPIILIGSAGGAWRSCK